MNAKSDSDKNADASKGADISKSQELSDEELKKVSGGKKISVEEASQQPGYAIGPAIKSK